MTVLLIVVGYLAFSLLLGVGVGRFIHAGQRPVPPTPLVGVAKPTTYLKRP